MTDALAAAAIPVLASALLHFLWQGAVVALLAALALALLRNARPQARYAVACIALFACAALPTLQVLAGLAAALREASAPASSLLPQAAAGTLHGVQAGTDRSLALPAAWLPWVVAAWASGATLMSLRLAGGLLWLRLLRRSATPAPAEWHARAWSLAARIGLRRRFALRITDGDTPLALGVLRPLVLLPATLLARLPADQLEALLAHELAHVRRHDCLVNLLQATVEALLFYHPATWWLSRRIRHERELIADAVAAEAIGDPRTLARALAALDRSHAATPAPRSIPTLAPAANGGPLMSRIERLVRPTRRHGAIAILLPLAGLALAGVAALAHARAERAPVAAPADPPKAAIDGPVRVASPSAMPAPPAPAAPRIPGPPAPPAPPAPAGPAAPVAPAARPAPPAPKRVAHVQGEGAYALMRQGQDGFAMSGDLDDVDTIRAARAAIDGDFLWVRRDGRAWVVRDPAAVRRAQEAWRPLRALEDEMRGHEAKMRPHQRELEALSTRMQALHVDDAMDTPAMRAIQDRLQAASREMQAVSLEHARLSMQAKAGSPREREAIDAAIAASASRQDAISRRIEADAAKIEVAAAEVARRSAPMEAMGREMERAGKPMEAIGRDMEAVGKRMEATAAVAEKTMHDVIDDAFARGLATPAPTRQ